jgi:hypothetical protein
MRSLALLLSLTLAIGFILGGCSSSTDPVDTQTTNLNEFGTYKATDEEPNFGDPDIAELIAESVEDAYDDPVAQMPLVDSVENAVAPDIFCFRMIWGNLPRDSGVTDLTDWSGTLTMSRGAVVVTHLIRFEPGQDYLLPRYNDEGYYVPEELRWVSKTSYHIDGLATRLYVPPSVTDDLVTVTYESPQLTITFTVDDLQDLDTLIAVGYGNAISFQAIRYEPGHGNPHHGTLAGRWGRDENGNGIFYGRWISARGRIMGTLKGNWGVDSTGNRIFVGKYIDTAGRFEGFVKGTWRENLLSFSPLPTGTFSGRIYNADREPIGLLKGHFHRGNSRRTGYFAGKWCVGESCFRILHQ